MTDRRTYNAAYYRRNRQKLLAAAIRWRRDNREKRQHSMNAQCGGIYRIDCLATGKFYVGGTRNLSCRKSHHWHSLRRGIKTNPGLASAFRLFGKESLSFRVLAVLEPGEVAATEARLLAQVVDDPLCLNVSPLVSGGGVPRSPETRAKIAALTRGRVASPETRRKLSAFQRTRRHTPETIALMSRVHMGKVLTPEWRNNLRLSQLGRKHPHTEATKEKMRRAALRRYGHEVSL